MDEEKIFNYALNLSEDGRILSATYPQYASEGMKIVDGLPEGESEDITDYIYHEFIDEDGTTQYYYDYSPLPIPQQTPEERIAELKRLLSETDYMAIKFAEGWITEEDYAETKAQRQAWRDEINELLSSEETVVEESDAEEEIVGDAE